MEEMGFFAVFRGIGWTFLDLDRALALNLQPMSYTGEFPLPTDPEKCFCTSQSAVRRPQTRAPFPPVFGPGWIFSWRQARPNKQRILE